MKRKLLPGIDSQLNLNINLLFARQFDEMLEKKGDFLIRMGMTANYGKGVPAPHYNYDILNSLYYVIDVHAETHIASRRINTLTQLTTYLENGYYQHEENKQIIPLLNLKLPNYDQVCRTQQLIYSDIRDKLIAQPIVGNYLRTIDNISFPSAALTMRLDRSPSILIHRIGDTDEITFTIGNKSNFSAFYEAIYIKEDGNIGTVKFQTFTNHPKEIHQELYKHLINPCQQVGIELNQEIAITKCGLIHLHRNKKLYPEDYYITRSENKIIALQTPVGGALTGDFAEKIPGGATSCAMYRVLNHPRFPSFEKKWIIITGHHGSEEGDDSVKGDYVRESESAFGDFVRNKVEKTVVECEPAELAELIKASGYQSGDSINILLYVCYGGLNKYGEYTRDESYARKLARCLAKMGISSTIVASDKPVGRFAGQYEPNEKEGVCLRFRVRGTPDNIIVVTGKPASTPGEEPIIQQASGKYPDGFYITADGLGSLEEIRRNKAARNQNANLTTPQPSVTISKNTFFKDTIKPTPLAVKNKNAILLLDFDGTGTDVAGEDLVFTEFYNGFRHLLGNENQIMQYLKQELISPIRDKRRLTEEFCRFLRKMLQLNLSICIITKNIPEYVIALLKLEGFTEEEIEKLVIKNRDGKDILASQYLSSLDLSSADHPFILICDDNRNEAQIMEEGVKAFCDQNNISSTIYPLQYKEFGQFDWNVYAEKIEAHLNLVSTPAPK